MNDGQVDAAKKLARQLAKLAEQDGGSAAEYVAKMMSIMFDIVADTHKDVRELSARLDEMLFHPRLASMLAVLKETSAPKRLVRDSAGNATGIEAAQ